MKEPNQFKIYQSYKLRIILKRYTKKCLPISNFQMTLMTEGNKLQEQKKFSFLWFGEHCERMVRLMSVVVKKDHTVTSCDELAVRQIIKGLETRQFLEYNKIFALGPSVSTRKINSYSWTEIQWKVLFCIPKKKPSSRRDSHSNIRNYSLRGHLYGQLWAESLT